ncbi:hypothetical protein CEXT_278351 [Caerostris extrusa]|uniref:Uncharacterized protein n=1 Tax=Caerostris extrusa TaxID=172846 RepID=A0AAV4W812_CAEEX|nr:hypothetical protein CEXT_278351 [Caerostris extrusa]
MAVCWTKLRDISASEASRKGALKNRRRCSRGGGRASSQSHRYHLCAHWCRKRCWDGEIRTQASFVRREYMRSSPLNYLQVSPSRIPTRAIPS